MTSPSRPMAPSGLRPRTMTPTTRPTAARAGSSGPSGSPASEAEIGALLDEVWAEAVRLEYTLLQGYVQEMRGEIALREGNYALAAYQFGQATLLMAHLAGRESNRFFDRLSKRGMGVNRAGQVFGAGLKFHGHH